MPNVVVLGNLGRDPEVKVAGTGTEYVSFSVAENIYNPQTQEREPLWFNIKVFRQRERDLIMKHFRKGSGIQVAGELDLPFVGNNGKVQMSMVMSSFHFVPRSNGDGAEAPVEEATADDTVDDLFA